MEKQEKQIEIELRSIFDKNTHDRLKDFLDKEATDLGEDNKDVYFFLFPDKLLKVTNNISGQSAKITLKLNKIGKGSDFEEIEIPIQPKDVDKSIIMFKHLGFNELQNSYQERHNYEYNGVELALKYTKTWGYHLEMEILVKDVAEKENAESKIAMVAKELGVTIMTDDELADFTKKIDIDYKKGKYDDKK
ncbi:CYTH domain-containing protein [Candidatus Woesebacteria bacterium]|nr:CYTH domain-containing protein [Candidatus Woesebacteria bacterium]